MREKAISVQGFFDFITVLFFMALKRLRSENVQYIGIKVRLFFTISMMKPIQDNTGPAPKQDQDQNKTRLDLILDQTIIKPSSYIFNGDCNLLLVDKKKGIKIRGSQFKFNNIYFLYFLISCKSHNNDRN